jgi:thiamine-phosphate pyrophosphorylase
MLGKRMGICFHKPIFPSISKKGYGIESTVIESLKEKNNPHVKAGCLRRIYSGNIQEVSELGVDGFVRSNLGE